jgi:hypothetical protein
MVGIAQLAERLVVVQEVAGSSPVTHPNGNDEGPEMSLRAFVVKKEVTRSRLQTRTDRSMPR